MKNKINFTLVSIILIFFIQTSGIVAGIFQTCIIAQTLTGDAGKIDLDKMKPVMLIPPPYKESLAKSGKKVNNIILKKSSEIANQITDEENWFSSNSLVYPSYTAPNPYMGWKGDIPGYVPERYGERILTDCFYDENYLYLIYGFNFSDCDILFICDKSTTRLLYSYDFTNYVFPPDFVKADKEFINIRVNWAKIDGGILYVSHAHSTYAASSKNMNAYITAISLETNDVVWRSRPLVCNSQNFLIEGDIIISGYGFTREKDYIYLIDKYSGEVLKSIKIKSAANMFIKKDGKLYIRTYDTDYVFDITKD